MADRGVPPGGDGAVRRPRRTLALLKPPRAPLSDSPRRPSPPSTQVALHTGSGTILFDASKREAYSTTGAYKKWHRRLRAAHEVEV
jgi:hypothetical protein